jgi:hypothetical protein
MPVRKPSTLLDTPERAEAVREAYHSTRDLRRNGITGFVLLELAGDPVRTTRALSGIQKWLLVLR